MGRPYTLMHKNLEVATLEIDEDNGVISKVIKVHDMGHMPVGTVVSNFVDGARVREWWSSRSIPSSRSGIRDVLESLGIFDAKLLLTRSMGLSLSDQYWVRPEGGDFRWDDVNFFDNIFSDDIGDLLMGGKTSENIDLMSPDNTSDGFFRRGGRSSMADAISSREAPVRPDRNHSTK